MEWLLFNFYGRADMTISFLSTLAILLHGRLGVLVVPLSFKMPSRGAGQRILVLCSAH